MYSTATNSRSHELVDQLPSPSSSSGQQLSVIGRSRFAALPLAPKLPIPRSGSTPTSRQRTPRACELCRERKTKCDGAKPICKQCRLLKTACTYSGSKRERQQLAIECARAKVKVYESVLRQIYEESLENGRTSIEEIFHVSLSTCPYRALSYYPVSGRAKVVTETLSRFTRIILFAPRLEVAV